MTLNSRFLPLLLAAACASLILTACLPAAAQTPAANTTQQEQNAQPAQVTPEKRPPPTTEGWWAQTTVYEDFIFSEICQAETLEEAKLCNSSRTNLSRMLGISKEEEQFMREIMLPIRVRLRQIHQEAADARFGSTAWPSDQLAALDKAQDREKKAIIDGMIARLKGDFSTEDFKKLDAWVYEHSSEGMATEEKARERNRPPNPHPARHSDPSRQANPSAPNPAKVVPQP